MSTNPYAEPNNRGTVTLQDYDKDLHLAMKSMASKQRVNLSLLYERAVEEFLNTNAPKRIKKSVVPGTEQG